MRALLISIYDMGRQPFGLASPAAWLRAAGWDVECIDVAKEPLREGAVRAAELVALHLPMHTATRLAAPVIANVRRIGPTVCVCAYGLYAPQNAAWLRSLGVDEVLGGEFEADLTAIARSLEASGRLASADSGLRVAGAIPRLSFLVPDRTGLPPLDRYATLQVPGGGRKLVAYTEASRGCRHRCRHCPVVPVYDGQFRIVQREVVLADIAAQVATGAEHVTFGDPDFFNGPTHALRLVEEVHAAFPQLTYDVTIKIEHLLRHRTLLPILRDTGCAFVTSAVESVDDAVLATLGKGHTRVDFEEAVRLCREVGITFVPTFVAFHPWLTLDGYCELLETIATLDLVDHVAPIQLAIRLLIPEESHLLEIEDVRRRIGRFDPTALAYRWAHGDVRVDRLQQDVAGIVGRSLAADRRVVFEEVRALACERAGRTRPMEAPARDRATVPYLNEPWYC